MIKIILKICSMVFQKLLKFSKKIQIFHTRNVFGSYHALWPLFHPGPMLPMIFPVIQIWWKFQMALINILTKRSLQNSAHATAVVACAKICSNLIDRKKITWNGIFCQIQWFTGVICTLGLDELILSWFLPLTLITASFGGIKLCGRLSLTLLQCDSYIIVMWRPFVGLFYRGN